MQSCASGSPTASSKLHDGRGGVRKSPFSPLMSRQGNFQGTLSVSVGGSAAGVSISTQ